VSGAAAILIALFGSFIGETGILFLIGIWGAGALCFYGVCVSHAIDRTPQGQVPQVMSGLLFVWAAGSIAGPLISGMAMRIGGAVGLFGFAGVMLGLLAVYMIVRVRQRSAAESPPSGERTTILPSPLASVEIMPRDPAEGEQS
jgi:MFS family permease